MIKSGSNKKARGSWLAILMIAALATFAFVGCPAEQITNDTTSVSATMTPASLAAPEITGKAFDGVNYVAWKPVKNATGYRIYRDSTILATVAYNSGSLEYYDYASLSSNSPSIKDGQSYTYTVVATGIQASRGTKTSTSNNTDFVMTNNDILGDSAASVTLTAKVPAVFSKVEAAKNVKVAYMEDVIHGRIIGVYFEKPAYLRASVKFAHTETGSNVDIFSYLAYHGLTGSVPPQPIEFLEQKTNQYVWVPAYAGKYKYQFITAWQNSFYQSNTDVSGDIVVPALDSYAPVLTAADQADGIKLSFTGETGVSYTLYRALDEGETYSFEVKAQGDAWTTQKCTGGNAYSFLDKSVEFNKSYVYLLTGTKDGKALKFNANSPAAAFIKHSASFAWNPQFAAFNNNGTVELSWNVEAGVTYKVLKCTVERDNPEPPALIGVEKSHTETYLNDGKAIDVGTPTLGVYVMTDTITKLAGTGYYKYTLIGENASKAVDTSADQIASYNTTNPTFTITSVYGVDTKETTKGFNGRKDKVYVAITAANSIDMSTVKFYRAEIATSDSTPTLGTFAGASTEFITGYTEVTLTPNNDMKTPGTTDTNYVYVDSTRTEDELAKKAYSYVAVVGGQSAKGVYSDSYNNINIPNIICELGKVTSGTGTYPAYNKDAKDYWQLSWNAEFADTLATAGSTTTQNANAAIVKVQTIWSNDNDITGKNVRGDWTDVSDVTLTDSTYFKQFTVDETKKTYHYLYVRVFFENAANKTVVSTAPVPPATAPTQNAVVFQIINRTYKAATLTEIGTIVMDSIYTDTYAAGLKKACVITTTTGDVELASDKYTVYVTYMAGTTILYSAPVPPTNFQKVKSVKDGSSNEVNTYYNADNPSWYFTLPTSEDTAVTNVLVHVTTSEGKVKRAVIAKYWD